MIFYCDLQGNLKAFQNETVYQGSNNVTTIYVVAPFSRPVGLNISFTKPNKLVTSPAIMKWVGTLGNVKIPVLFVNIPEQFTDTYNVWAYALPYSITEQNGVVGVSVNAVIADSVDTNGQQAYKGNLTTFTGQFTVAYSALPSPPTDIPTEWTQDKVLDLLNNYYNDAIQKIGEMNTLKTDAKDTLVKAINEVFDEIASTNATIGDLSALTTDEKTTIVGAINEVDAHADTAQQTADNAKELANTGISKAEQAQATANNAVATANEAKTTAQTAETNANSALDTANAANTTAGEAKAIAQGSQRAIGFATLQAAITALNGYSNTQLKVGDNVYIVETGVPDLWVAAVEPNSVAYNYTTNDAFNDDLVENTLVQVGYYKFAYLGSDGKPCTVAWQNMTVAASDWVASTEFEDFAYEAKIILSDFVNFSSIPQVVFGLTEATSGNYAPICKAGDKGVYIYSKVNTAITLPTVVTFAPNVHGASMQGGGYTNKGKWVASTTYAIDDLVYTDNGQYVCIEGITSTTSPEQDTTHWQATFVATGKTKNGLTISGQDNGTGVQKTFDGSAAVEIAFDETTMTAKEVDGVLKVGAKGTIPEALPQEASALKIGSLPTSGWTAEAANIVTTTAQIKYNSDTTVTQIDADIAKLKTGWEITLTGDKQEYSGTYYNQYSSGQNRIVYKFDFDGGNHLYELTDKFGNTRFSLKIYGNGEIKMSAADRDAEGTYTIGIKNTTYSQWVFSISDTSITANSDVLMELTDDGGVKAYSMEAGKVTVIRDTVPTQPIPYTYKVKQTNASGQFTLVNHFVPSIPESPTSLPVTYKKVSGSLPTSGWTEVTTPNLIWEGTQRVDAKGAKDIYNSSLSFVPTSEMKADTEPTHWQYKKSDGTWANVQRIYTTDGTYNGLFLIITPNGAAFSGYEFLDGTNFMRIANGSTVSDDFYGIRYVGFTQRTYTISDTDITANTAVKMYLTDEGGVKAQSKAVGSITVIRDSVPTTAIPYEYEVEETSAEGLFEVINAYVPEVPTKTSQLTNDSGFITSADIPSAGEWVDVPGETATLTQAGTYQVVLYGSDRNVQSIIYWDGSTAAQGIYSTVVDLLESRPVMVSRFPQITAEGVISFGWVSISQSVQGDWLESNTTASGFKYRKIN